MNTNTTIDYQEANVQWSKLKDSLLSHHIEVDLVEMPMKSLPDFVFTANAGMIINNIAVVSSFRDEQRKKESKYFYKWFQHHGYKVYQLPKDIVWEGEACTL
jgi:N-dimethylarginine dimethylaminohydrolase